MGDTSLLFDTAVLGVTRIKAPSLSDSSELVSGDPGQAGHR